MRRMSRAWLRHPWLSLIRAIGVLVPKRLRSDWRQEWEAELRYREAVLGFAATAGFLVPDFSSFSFAGGTSAGPQNESGRTVESALGSRFRAAAR